MYLTTYLQLDPMLVEVGSDDLSGWEMLVREVDLLLEKVRTVAGGAHRLISKRRDHAS